MSKGASADADRATRPSDQAATRLGDSASVPSAGNNEPAWFPAAKGLAAAIMFQRGTRGVHVVGKDGRVRMGCVNLLGSYAVDDAAREFCEMAGIEFKSLEPPTEHEAMFMMGVGLRWLDWLNDAPGIRAMARGNGHRSKVDIAALASAIEAATAGETVQQGSTEGESAVPGRADAQPLTGDTDA